MKSIASFLLFFFFSTILFAQEVSLNQYKYVIVNGKFEFVNQPDGYSTSSFTKFLFNKKGFEAYKENEELPQDIAMNRCKALYADVRDDSGMLVTRLYIELKDCKGSIIYTTKKGTSRLKDYTKAYRQSIREAFKSIQGLNYQYNPKIDQSKGVNDLVKKESNPKPEKSKKPLIVTKEVKVDTKSQKEVPQKKFKNVKAKTNSIVELLYAQKTKNGFQLVNTKPEIVCILLNTSNSEKTINR